MMEQVASYIAGEMNRNITHPSVLKMRKLTSFDATEEHAKFQKLPWYARLLPPDFQAMMVGNTAAAMALWTERVGQNRPWDHKVAIAHRFGRVWHKHGEVDYYYDIWSNIHYGYVGRGAFQKVFFWMVPGLSRLHQTTFGRFKIGMNKMGLVATQTSTGCGLGMI